MHSNRGTHYENYAIKGYFSKEFLESMGMTKVELPIFNNVTKLQPLPGPVGLAYAKRCILNDEQTRTEIDS